MRRIVSIHHKGDIWFHEAPTPRRLHRCTAWTVVLYDDGVKFERCACGGIRVTGDGLGRGGPFVDKNSERKG